MSAVVILKLPDADPVEASRFATRLLKEALAPLGPVEVFTFDQVMFEAHWRPLGETPRPRVTAQPEHTQAPVNGRRRSPQ